MKKTEINPFTKFDKDWALVTAGTKEKFNSMTISWGAMGTIWFKPTITIYVRPDRYTYEFIKSNDIFTVAFFKDEYKRALGIMGSTSGRDTDKVKDARLTPKYIENGITFEEAEETYICKKIYMAQMDMTKFPKDAMKCYDEGAEAHYLIIGEVIGKDE